MGNKKRCGMKQKGKMIFEYCPMTCGKCSDSPDDNDTDDEKPDNNNDDEDLGCEDDSEFLFRNKDGMTCDRMNKKRCGMKQNGKKIFEYCPMTCGKCSDDNDDEKPEKPEEKPDTGDGDDDDDDDDDNEEEENNEEEEEE